MLVFPRHPTLDDWNDSEYSYCAELVRNGGVSVNMSKDQVPSYLSMQSMSARGEGRADVADAIKALLQQYLLEVTDNVK